MCDEINHDTVGQLTVHMYVSEYKIPRERQRDSSKIQKRGDGQKDTHNMGKTRGSAGQYSAFSSKAFANIITLESLHYEGKRCWANLAEMYTEEAHMPVISDTYSLSSYLSARIYDG
jgi:hypothetical protein